MTCCLLWALQGDMYENPLMHACERGDLDAVMQCLAAGLHANQAQVGGSGSGSYFLEVGAVQTVAQAVGVGVAMGPPSWEWGWRWPTPLFLCCYVPTPPCTLHVPVLCGCPLKQLV